MFDGRAGNETIPNSNSLACGSFFKLMSTRMPTAFGCTLAVKPQDFLAGIKKKAKKSLTSFRRKRLLNNQTTKLKLKIDS